MSADLLKRTKEVCANYVSAYGSKKESTNPAKGKQRVKIISISDLHIPFARLDLVSQIIKEHSGAEYCVVNGDIFDSYIISKYPKSKEVPFAVEYSAAFNIVVELSKNFGEVILVDGNHEKGRFATELNKLNQSVRFLIKSSPLEYIAEGLEFTETGEYKGKISLPNVKWAGEKGNPSWYYQIGGALFGHRLSGFKKGPLSNTVDMADHFLKHGVEFQCLITGHSHHAGFAPYLGRLLIDQGCLCLEMEYTDNGSCRYHPADLGYVEVYLDKTGNVDFEMTKLHMLGSYGGRK